MCRKNVQGNQYSLFKGQMFSKPQGEGYTFLISSLSRWFIQQFGDFMGLCQYFHSKFFELKGKGQESYTTALPSTATEASSKASKKSSVPGTRKDIVVLWTVQKGRRKAHRCWDRSGHIENTRF